MIKPLVEIDDLKTSFFMECLKRGQKFHLHYDKASDNLLITYTSPFVETVVHYLDNHTAIVYEYDSREIVGFQIEGFS